MAVHGHFSDQRAFQPRRNRSLCHTIWTRYLIKRPIAYVCIEKHNARSNYKRILISDWFKSLRHHHCLLRHVRLRHDLRNRLFTLRYSIENNRETAVFLLKIFSNLYRNLKSYWYQRVAILRVQKSDQFSALQTVLKWEKKIEQDLLSDSYRDWSCQLMILCDHNIPGRYLLSQ